MDFEAGKPLETDVLLAAPVELARLVGVPAPTLELSSSMRRPWTVTTMLAVSAPVAVR